MRKSSATERARQRQRTLSKDRGLAGLVLRDLVEHVLAALASAQRAARLGNVHLEAPLQKQMSMHAGQAGWMDGRRVGRAQEAQTAYHFKGLKDAYSPAGVAPPIISVTVSLPMCFVIHIRLPAMCMGWSSVKRSASSEHPHKGLCARRTACNRMPDSGTLSCRRALLCAVGTCKLV